MDYKHRLGLALLISGSTVMLMTMMAEVGFLALFAMLLGVTEAFVGFWMLTTDEEG